MIKYKLACKDCETTFDSWFSSSKEFEKLKKKRLLICHICNSKTVDKSLMAPSLRNNKKDTKNDLRLDKYDNVKKTIKSYQKFIKENFKFVGENFAYEARSIHYDSKKNSKGIYGNATKKDLQEQKEVHQEDNHSFLIYDIPRSAPALLRAQRIGEKAASVGFDWPDIGGSLDKVEEEIQEIKEALSHQNQEEIRDEIGDLFFALVNVCRWLKISPSDALEQTNRKFQSRFAYIEKTIAQKKGKFEEHTLEELETFWQEAKYKEKK